MKWLFSDGKAHVEPVIHRVGRPTLARNREKKKQQTALCGEERVFRFTKSSRIYCFAAATAAAEAENVRGKNWKLRRDRLAGANGANGNSCFEIKLASHRPDLLRIRRVDIRRFSFSSGSR